MPLGILLVMKTLKEEWYAAIKAYKLTIFEILRDFIYCVSALSLHIESIDSVIVRLLSLCDRVW